MISLLTSVLMNPWFVSIIVSILMIILQKFFVNNKPKHTFEVVQKLQNICNQIRQTKSWNEDNQSKIAKLRLKLKSCDKTSIEELHSIMDEVLKCEPFLYKKGHDTSVHALSIITENLQSLERLEEKYREK